MKKRVLAVLLVVAFLAGTLTSEAAHATTGDKFGCNADPLPFGLGHIYAIQYNLEVYCGS